MAESGDVDDNEQSWMQTSVTVNDGDKMSFYWKVSHGSGGGLYFYINDQYQADISGNVDWQKKSYTFSGSGTKTLKWVYHGVSGSGDYGWVDGLVIGDGLLVPPPDGYYSEALDSDLKFTSVADDDDTWYVDDGGYADYYYDGDAARTDDTLDDSNESCLQTIVVCDSNETITFYWKVSSEEDADYLQFYIDGTLQDQISGEVDWTLVSREVDAGTRTLKWRYIKNGSGYSGDDCGWVDFVQWTGPSPAQDPANWQEIAYRHDVLGRRVEKKVDGFSTRYVYDGPHVIAEYDGNNNLLRKYIYGPGIDQPVCMIEVADANAVYYYHHDGLGSIVALSDAAGDTVQTYEYSVYGEVAVEDANHTNPYMFAGVRYDIEIGLYYNRARYYNPFTGRFLQTDPIGYADGMNWYAYCGNNPGNLTDPSGTASFSFSEVPDGPLAGYGIRCTVTDDAGNKTIYDACDISAWVGWMSGKDDIFTDKWMKGQAGWTLSGEDERTFWYLMAINELLGGAGGDGFDYAAMEAAGVKVAKQQQINAFGQDPQPRNTWVNFDQGTNRIYWSENIVWNDPSPIPAWASMSGAPMFALGHELQEAENHLDGADLVGNRDHGIWSHEDAIRTENLLRKKFMSFQPKRYPGVTKRRYYRPGGHPTGRPRGRAPWEPRGPRR